MNEKIKKLISYHVTQEMSEEHMCDDLGITRRTFNNLKKNKCKPHISTIKKIDFFIKEKGL